MATTAPPAMPLSSRREIFSCLASQKPIYSRGSQPNLIQSPELPYSAALQQRYLSPYTHFLKLIKEKKNSILTTKPS
jgi:hypothetical protein